jgi:hypothetical protein
MVVWNVGILLERINFCVLFVISPNQKLCATTTSNNVKRKKWVLWMLGFVKFDSFLYCHQ